MKQRLVKSWMLYSAVYSFVSTVFLFLFRRWIRYEIVETFEHSRDSWDDYTVSIIDFILWFCDSCGDVDFKSSS